MVIVASLIHSLGSYPNYATNKHLPKILEMIKIIPQDLKLIGPDLRTIVLSNNTKNLPKKVEPSPAKNKNKQTKTNDTKIR